MLETQSENNPRPTIQVVLGFLLGILIALGGLFFSIFLSMTLNVRQGWITLMFMGVALLGAGIIAIRRMKESSYALGVAIALALALLLDVVWGVAIGNHPLMRF